jgi:hypothetical protein
MLALIGFTYILLGRANFARELLLAGAVVVAGALAYAGREEQKRTRARGQTTKVKR